MLVKCVSYGYVRNIGMHHIFCWILNVYIFHISCNKVLLSFSCVAQKQICVLCATNNCSYAILSLPSSCKVALFVLRILCCYSFSVVKGKNVTNTLRYFGNGVR